MKKIFSLLAFILLASPLTQAQGTMLLREPTLSDSHIVFVHANDLWKTSVDGGVAVRLTSNEGYESLPHFSQDGKWIAFTAEYDGNVDVYVIPSEGGEPKRLTFHPSGDFVQGWTPEGEIMFRSSRESHPTQTNKFYKVGMDGGLPQAIEIPRAAYGEISPDGDHIAYTPITSWDPEWRNYRGGQAMPIWIVDMKTKELIRTPQKDKERHLDPIWVGDKVFYLSERDYASNIWSYDPVTSQEKQMTFHDKFDVKSLDSHKDMIVYEQGGYLHLLNTNTGATKQLVVNVSGDFNFNRPRWEDVSANDVSNPAISPNGKRAVFEYRGEIITTPREEGSWRNLTKSSGVADRFPVWSPEGDRIAWFSDEKGEYQLVVSDQYGQNRKFYELENPTFYFRPDWAPDGKHIAYTDTDYNIWYINLDSGKVTKVDTDRYAHPNRAMNPVWSPDSRYITYERQLDSHFKAIFIYDTQTGKAQQVTDGMADSVSPVWSESGDYLYFLASTDYGLNSGWLDMSSYDPDVTRALYAIVLSQDGSAPNLPSSDEEEVKSAATKEDKKEEEKTAVKPIQIAFEGIQDRIVALNLPLRNYQFLLPAPGDKVFVAEAIQNEDGLKIHNYDVKKEKAEDYADKVRAMVVSSTRKDALLNSNGGWSISSTSGTPKPEDKLNIDAKIKVDPSEEYAQIFREGWRFMRDFLYVSNVHGAPWDKVYSWYQPWVEHAKHRTDLNYLVDILSGEVAIGHSYVSGGDMPDIDRVPVGLLGADFKIDKNRYRIENILDGEDWNPDIETPLGKPGMDIKEGDYIIAINGVDLKGDENIYKLLEQTAGRIITLTVNDKPQENGARKIFVKPVRSENDLRSIEWVEANRRKVDELSNGKIAYVYIPNTSGAGFSSFNRYYFAQQDKKGVVLDERNNGGGSAADYMIDVLTRAPIGYFNSKANDNRPWTTPIAGIWGPKVMIINERAGSGGDLLPYMFKHKEIGPLIGTRTWGGLVGTWDTPRFIDGGRMVAPRGGFYDLEGNWGVEGEGVAPDIEVIQEPKEVLAGKDPQLERAVKEALEMLKTQEFKLEPEPAAPVRWKRPKSFDTSSN